MTKPALASIGVPVFNEARYIERTLDSLLAQDYENLEILITDRRFPRTRPRRSVCERASRDERIRYQRWPSNLGAIRSFRDVLDRAHGEYFCWVGGHDRLEPSYVSQCVERMRSHPECILAYSFFQHIDEDDGSSSMSSPRARITMTIDDPLERIQTPSCGT